MESLRLNPDLILPKGISPGNLLCSNALQEMDFLKFIDAMRGDPTLPIHPPFEKHPYLELVDLASYRKYIIGTFPPISYVADIIGVDAIHQPTGRPIPKPWIPFFHGNRGSMWKYLLTSDEYLQLTTPANDYSFEGRIAARNNLIQFLRDSRLNYSDIIRTTQRSLKKGAYTPNDSHLWNVCVNNNLILQLLLNGNATSILFNTGSSYTKGGFKILQYQTNLGLQGQVDLKRISAFDLFVRGCQELGLLIELRIVHGPTQHFGWTEIGIRNRNFLEHQMRTKLIFDLRISGKVGDKYLAREFVALTPASPASISRGMAWRNKVIQKWCQINIPGMAVDHILAGKFIRHVYSSFRNTDALELYEYNC